MQTAQNFFAAVNNTGLGFGIASAEAAVAADEDLAQLQLETGKASMYESFELARRAVAVKDAGELFALTSKWSQDATEKLLGYSRNYVSITQEAQQHVEKFVDGSGPALQRELLETIEKSISQSPVPGGQSVLTVVKSAMTSATTAMGAVDQAAKQFTEYAGASLEASPMGAVATKASPRKRAS